MDTGRSSNTPEEWEASLRSSFLDERSKPATAWLSCVFDFASLYRAHRAILGNYGPCHEFTAAPGEQPSEGERSSHLRAALIRMDPGSHVASIRFAQNAMAAEREDWYPLCDPPASAAAGAPKVWCSLAGHVGATVIKQVPDDAPTRVQYTPQEDWDKFNSFQATLLKLDGIDAWPRSAVDAWRRFLAHPPCVLRGVPWNLAALQSAPRLSTAPVVRAGADERVLVVDPLITETRTKAQKAADELAAGCGVGGANFDIPFDRLELLDFAIALAHHDAPWAFTLKVRGKTSPMVELLEIEALTPPGQPKQARRCFAPALPRPPCERADAALAAAGDLALLEARGSHRRRV
jgi:hypothetical protein